MRRPTVVLGLGNPLMADEGIGVYLVERLMECGSTYPSVDFVDGGTGGLAILHQIEGRRKAIIIDCAAMREPPGTIRRFGPEEVRSSKVLAHQSLHAVDLMQIIGLARQLRQAPDQIVIFGIEPESVVPRQGLSPTLRSRIDVYRELIVGELEA